MAVRITGTYTDWRWPDAPDGYASFEWELTPHTDPTPDGYFWSHQFWLVGGESGYVGLQTLGSEPTGKIAIFSIWDAVTAGGPVYMSRFDGEGEGYSVSRPCLSSTHASPNGMPLVSCLPNRIAVGACVRRRYVTSRVSGGNSHLVNCHLRQILAKGVPRKRSSPERG